MAVTSAMGQTGTYRNIGYVTGDQIDVSGAIFDEASTYTVGARLKSNILGNYVGCKVVGIRLASALDLGRTQVGLYSIAADNKMTLIKNQRQRIYEGWNEVYFNGSDVYEITPTSDLFYCFDYVETEEMIAAEKGGICSAGYDQSNAFLLYNGNTLYDISNVGALCIQLIVDITNLPADNLGFTYFDSGFKYKTFTDKMELFTTVANLGREDVKTFEVSYDFDGKSPVTLPVDTLPLKVGTNDSWLYAIDLNKDLGIGAHTLNMQITKVNGKELPQMPNSRKSVNFAIYENQFNKSLAYVEVYNSQDSYFVPFLSAGFNNMSDNTKARCTIVNTVAPGGTLAHDDAAYLHSLYAYTYPCFSINRSYFPGEQHVAYDINDYLLIFPPDFTSVLIEDMVLQDYDMPAFSTIELSGKYDEATRQLTVFADGEMLDELKAIYGTPALTLMLVEDGVVDRQVVVGEGNKVQVSNSYMHDNLLRAYITSPKGDKIPDTGKTFSMEYKTTLDAAWNPSKMRVVGIISKQADDITANNVKDYDVTNATELNISTLSVETFNEADNDSTVTVFTLQGIRVLDKADRSELTTLPKGIYVVNGKKLAI